MIKGKKTIYITIFFICIMLSSIIFMQFKTARETNITDIQNMNEDELKKEITNLRIQEYEDVSSKGEKNSDVLEKERREALMLARTYKCRR